MSTKMSLYNIALEGMEIEDILIANEGELTPELEARLDSLLIEGPKRIEAAAMVVRSLEASQEACIVEVDRMVARAKSFEKQANRLKERIVKALDSAFSGKVKTDLFSVWNQTSPATVSFDLAPEVTIDMLPTSLVRVTKELDKKRVAELHKAGMDLGGAITVTAKPGTRYLRLK